jgi:BirA family transcriptional regulator, biotin operon repressor / biotin---[acetyl-CoA-carboxylase] ligase
VSAVLTREGLEAGLTTRRIGRVSDFANEVWETIESTSSRAAALAGAGALEGVVVAARLQTAGRGRFARTWLSPLDAGLYMSFLLRPQLSMQELPILSLAGGVACVQAIYSCCRLKVGLKWVNDLIVDGRKIGGILAEMPAVSRTAGSSPLPPPVILGVGINLSLPADGVPTELLQRIDCLENLCGRNVDVNMLAAEVTNAFEGIYDLVLSGQSGSILQQWKQFSVTLGREIRAAVGDSIIEGTAIDITSSGALVVSTPSGELHTLVGGEVSIRNQDGSYA